MSEAEQALERGVRHGRAGADRQGELFRLGQLASVVCMGPMPVQDALARLPTLVERSGGSKVTETRVLWNMSLMEAMRGRIDEGRRSWARGREIARELGILFPAHMFIGWAELAGGDPAEAEDLVREGIAE